MKKILCFIALCLLTVAQAFATDYYLSASGSDSHDGKSRGNAFATLGKAQSVVTAGDKVYILPDTFKVKSSEISLTESIYKIVYNFKQKGSYGKPISFIGLTEGGKRPVFDMSAVNPKGYRITAFYVTGQYLVFRNFEVIGIKVNITDHTQSENFRVRNGSHNTFDNIACHDGMGIGFYLTHNSSHNLFLNCDAYNNYDPVSEEGKGGQNDGFGCHVQAGNENNIFIGCRTWNNADDGYDLIHCFSPVTFCYSIAYHNGYDADDNKRQDGNGFKAGGYGMSAQDVSLPSSDCPRHQVYHCLSLSNKSSGFYANHHLGGIDVFNNTAVSNGGYNFNMLNRKGASASDNTDVAGYGHRLEKNLSVGSKHVTNLDTGSGKNTIKDNSFTWKNSTWTNSYTATFESENLSRLTRARKSNGMLSATTTLTVYNQTEYIGMGCDFSGYEEAIVAAKGISGAELVETATETTVSGVDTNVKANSVTKTTTWDFSDLSAGTIGQYVDYKDLVMRATSGSHAITVDEDGCASLAANGANIASYLNQDRTAADDLDNATYDRCLAFNAGVAGTTTVTFSSNKDEEGRYFQIYFKAVGKETVVKEVAASKEQTVVSLTSTEAGTFFIVSTIGCKVFDVNFIPAISAGLETNVQANEVIKNTTWDFSKLSACTIEQYVEYNDLVLRATSGSHAITVNKDGSISFAGNGANVASYLNNEKTAADNLNSTSYDRCLAFNAGISGKTIVTFSANKEEEGRYFQVFFKAPGKDAVVEEVAVSKEKKTVTLTSVEEGCFFITSTIACNIHDVKFVPTPVISTDVTGKPVTRRRVWDFTALSTSSIEQYTDYNDLVLRATSGSHAITVNEDGSISFAANGSSIASYLNNEKTAADNLNNTSYDRCLAFNTGVAGKTTVTFGANKDEEGRYFQIFFKAPGKDAVVEEVAVTKAQTTVTLTSNEAGTFFIASTIGSTVYDVEFEPSTTGIFSVFNNANNYHNGNSKAYTLTGLNVENGYRGIVIRNGKKYFVK